MGLAPMAQPPGIDILALFSFEINGPRTNIDPLIVFTIAIIAKSFQFFFIYNFYSLLSLDKIIFDPRDFNKLSIVVTSCTQGRL